MNTLHLTRLLDEGPAALTTASGALATQQARLDCSGVARLTTAQLDALFAAIPADWDVADLHTVIAADTLSDTLARQIVACVDERLGRIAAPAAEQRAAEQPRTAVDLRRILEEALINDLHGPCDGPEEIVDERNVRGRYVAGLLAPKGQSAMPEIFDDSDPHGRASEDGTTDAPPSKAASTMLPSSIGMTFSVAADATALAITARWGRYERVDIEDDAYRNKDGSLRRVWQRQPIEGHVSPLPLTPGRIEACSPCPDYPEVTVQGVVRQREHQWIVTLFLVNGQEETQKNQDSAWLFQPELIVTAPDGAPIFQRRAPISGDTEPETQMMAMRYRNEVEFAVGHGVGVDWTLADGARDRATRITTAVIPVWEVPQTTPPTAEDIPALAALTLDMKVLADVPDGQFGPHLLPLVTAYEGWIATQEQRLAHPTPDLQPYLLPGAHALNACRAALERIRAGITLLDTNPDAAAAFRFANRAMALQRVRGLYAASVRRGETPDLAVLDVPRNHSWRTFQLGFVLLNLPGLTDLHHAERVQPLDPAVAHPGDNIADLLWFPTGGGKTEAYLGLAAYTMAIRRLQGTIAGRSGHAGVAVLMRYTLRLLTLQQFQRAAALLCACEVIRRDDPARWGSEPFRIGLWVGQNSTPNWVKDAEEAIKQLKKGGYTGAGSGSPNQLTTCPWCGSAIEPDQIVPEPAERGRARVITYCGDALGRCPFSHKQAPGEGVPVMVVDEEIYRRLPSLLIATVDKFAQMPWNGRIAALFGQVDGYCERHGYHTPDMDDRSTHQASKKHGLPASRFLEVSPLRPPDLIIQDELHLISGPLGTLVGLYETAVDTLASWEVDGQRVRPKVIASTATIRRAGEQVHHLFARQVQIFPPQGLDADDTFFARQRPISERHPGRRYLGICTPGIRHKTALIQTSLALLAAAQWLYEQDGKDADPWMTLVGYFNSLRELAAMRRAVDDAVSTRLKKMDRRGLAKRFLDPNSVQELTSRLSAADIPEILDRLETPFDPASRAAAQAAKKAGKAAQTPPSRFPVDVLLATNMISVGVDVSRLGLMLVGGQPKATAEYIQATSRVGRQHPGLVCTVYNWARPRDLSHYERFCHYHATFYQHVEALSVTPFSPRALDRGLSALLASLIRLREPTFNPNAGAGQVTGQHPVVQATLAQIAARAAHVNATPSADLVQNALEQRMDAWQKHITATVGATLGYKAQRDGTTVGLLRAPGESDWHLFACLNSLRDVEPTVNLVLDDAGMDDHAGQTWTLNAQDDQPAEASAADS
jgi:hypothetical protein